MPTPKVTRDRFSATNPDLQIQWNSSSLDPLKTCPRKYELTILRGWRSKREKATLVFGERYHRALEIYAEAEAKGENHDDALLQAVTYCLGFVVRGTHPETGEPTVTPWITDDPDRNRFTLTRAVVWYFDKYREDPAQTIILASGKPAVELAFNVGLGAYAETGEEFSMFGKIDRIVQFGADKFIMDRKTTSGSLGHYYFNQYAPHNQMSLYITMGMIAGLDTVKGAIIDAVQLAVGFARFARHLTYRTKGSMEEWLRDALGWIRQAERYANEGYWPQNDTACDKYGGCQFRDICKADPSVRELYLRSDFEQRTEPEA